jgi:muconolactone D-isomerase
LLFQVEMDVKVPHDVDLVLFEELKRAEKSRAEELQKSGVWRHLWRVVGHYRNVSIFDVPGNTELHAILSTLPLFPFMEMRVTALCRHPSSIHEDDR